MSNDDILQNLKDAGCDSVITDRVIVFLNSGDKSAALNLLAKHQTGLLNLLHENQKKIDCLDFWVFNLKQKI